MDQTNVTIMDGVVTLTSSPVDSDEGNSGASPHLKIRYRSGTFYLKEKITICPAYPVWDFSGQFKVPTETGTWPAFWITGAKTWPPESDFMEFKGTAECHQNTYDGRWQAKITPVPHADTVWHTYRTIATLENSTNVGFQYFIDGVLESEQTADTFVSSPCWLIIDYQMEGDSGSPGPNQVTRFAMTNIVVRRKSDGPAGTVEKGRDVYASNTGPK